eukprot:156332_1
MTEREHILDMYLNLNSGELSFVINGKLCMCLKVNTEIEYRMVMWLKPRYCAELVSYHHSKLYKANRNEDIISIRGYINCISSVDEKIFCLEKAIKTHPEMKAIRNDYIHCLVNQKLYEKLYEYIVEYNIQHMENIDIIAIADHFYCKQENYEKAARIYSLIKANNPLLDEHLCSRIGHCYYVERDFKNSLIFYKKCYDKIPNDSRIWFKIGHLYFLQHNWHNALLWMQKYQIHNPNDPNCIAAIAEIYKYNGDLDKYPQYAMSVARLYQTGNQQQKALEYCMIAINIEQNNCDLCSKYESFLMKCAEELEQQNWNDALIAYEKVLELKDQNDWELHFKIAQYYELQAKPDYNLIVYHYRKLLLFLKNCSLTADAEAGLCQIIANLYEVVGDWHNTLFWNKELCKIDPNNPQSATNIAAIYSKHRKIYNANEYFTIALDMEKGNKCANTHFLYGQFLSSDCMQYQEAINYYHTALKLTKDSEMKLNCYQKIATALERLDDVDGALFHTQKALSITPNNVHILHELGYYYLLKKQYKQSYKYLKKCLDIDSKNNETLNIIIANTLCGMNEINKYEEAIPFLVSVLSTIAEKNYIEISSHELVQLKMLQKIFARNQHLFPSTPIEDDNATILSAACQINNEEKYQVSSTKPDTADSMKNRIIITNSVPLKQLYDRINLEAQLQIQRLKNIQQTEKLSLDQTNVSISIINTPLKHIQDNSTENLLKVGDKIQLEEDRLGVVKYIGSTHFMEDEMVGIELNSWSPNGHNGKVKGRTYFKASPGCGTFIRRCSIVQYMPKNLRFIDSQHKPMQWIQSREYKTVNDEEINENEIKIDLHVGLTRGKTGYIRYIGEVGNVDELIGIELDSWHYNGHDGKGYFKCAIGRGYFTKRTNIIGIISETKKSSQEQLQLKRHRNIRKL